MACLLPATRLLCGKLCIQFRYNTKSGTQSEQLAIRAKVKSQRSGPRLSVHFLHSLRHDCCRIHSSKSTPLLASTMVGADAIVTIEELSQWYLFAVDNLNRINKKELVECVRASCSLVLFAGQRRVYAHTHCTQTWSM